MAQVTLTAIGSAIGGPVGGAIGATLGAMIDRAAIEALRPPREAGPRLTGLHVSSAAEGAPMPAVFGRARVAGQVIWAARFRERRVERRTGGGKGGPRTVEAAYSLSFAVALGEGPIDGIGRVWADGKLMDMTGVVMRLHRGDAEQGPDPLIEAVEGTAPGYRGTAYVVFEDLAVAPFGNRAPNLSFEVFRRPGGTLLEDRLEGVCLIPGAGEFVYATETVRRRESLTRVKAENVNNTDGRPDVVVALDRLQAQLPNVRRVTVVVSWFGDDLRAAECEVRPGVETAEKQTLPFAWRAGGVDRAGARLLAGPGGAPAYGGTPTDRTVLQLIEELKRRGLEVGLYPFLMMDVPPGNGLPDPYGGPEQAAYPWRGRITCASDADGTVVAGAQVATFFGPAVARDFTAVEGEPRYGGTDWGFSRMVLHYAKLAQLAGGVDTFLIGSELRGLTRVRDEAGHPAVRALRKLAQEARALLPDAALGYAADWSEWFGHQPADGSGDVTFHLDPLWADPAVSFVGIDWYPPMTDWRDGSAHLDAQAGFRGPHDPEYLASRVAGGEGWDWFYASEADRSAQARTPIADGAHGEPWVFRPKDLVGWWSHAHHDRTGGVRAVDPTPWIPRSKPIRFVEFGCPAVDKGANSPNLFLDPKSAESALPPFSDGRRDDLGQRRALEAVLGWFAAPENNPVSELYGGPMLEAMDAWCWDARPFPDFPARSGVWADAANWSGGHWLSGRAGVGAAAELIAAVLARGGVGPAALDLSEADGAVTGYVVDRPMPLRDALAPLLTVFGLEAAERDERIALVARCASPGGEPLLLGEEDLASPENAAPRQEASRTLTAPPSAVRVRFVDEAGEYGLAAAGVTSDAGGDGGALHLDLAVVAGRGLAERVGRARLAQEHGGAEEATVRLGPVAALRLQAGDRVRLEAGGPAWRVLRVELDEAPKARLVRVGDDVAGGEAESVWRVGPVIEPAAPPVLHVLDLPALRDADPRPLVAVAGEPWRPVEVLAGAAAASLTPRARAASPAAVGVTLTDLPRGPLHRLSEAELRVRIEGGVLQSRTLADAAAGANALAVLTPSGEWEIVQFLQAELIAPETYRLTGLLRGQAGTDAAMTDMTPAGAPVVVLDDPLVRAEVGVWERGAPLLWRAAAAGRPQDATEATFTWRALAERPWSPAHLRARRRNDGGLRLTWVRRARLGGDTWEAEAPLGEEQERYLAEVLDGGEVVRAWEVTSPTAEYAATAIAEDFPAGLPNPLRVRVRQASATFGWGAAALRGLWH
jgi:hypothetical protein